MTAAICEAQRSPRPAGTSLLFRVFYCSHDGFKHCKHVGQIHLKQMGQAFCSLAISIMITFVNCFSSEKLRAAYRTWYLLPLSTFTLTTTPLCLRPASILPDRGSEARSPLSNPGLQRVMGMDTRGDALGSFELCG